MRSQFRYEVLGQVRAWRGEVELDLGSPQQQAVLAVLLLRQGHTASHGELITALWGDTVPPTAAGTIRTYVSRLRKTLIYDDVTEGIITSGGGYHLRIRPQDVDLQRLRVLSAQGHKARKQGDLSLSADLFRQAVALWNGVPLAGLPGPYAQAQSDSLTQLWTTTRADLAAVELELGNHQEVLNELAALAAEHPLREEFHELLMTALARSGRRAEALAVHRQIRVRLSEELGIDPGPRLQDLQMKVLNDAVDLVGRPRREHRAPAGPPRQLPPDLPDFTGRERELGETVRALTTSSAVPVVAVSGPGGVGKTALAVRAAHRVAEHFPDGQFYVQLNALDDRPADPHRILAGLLGSMGVGEERLPAGTAERAALWRTTLAGRKVLLLLDDAADAGQVRHLLPATGGCVTVVTGRRRIPELPGCHWLALDVLSRADAVKLLARVAGPGRVDVTGEAAWRVTDACSSMPHAIRLAGARLRARPHWSVAELADRLVAEAGGPGLRDNPAIAPFERSYRRLEERQARAFRALASSDSDIICVETAANLLDLPMGAAETVLEDLADLHLLEAGGRGQYRYLPLVKVFARQEVLARRGTTPVDGHPRPEPARSA